jgi:BolA protein
VVVADENRKKKEVNKHLATALKVTHTILLYPEFYSILLLCLAPPSMVFRSIIMSSSTRYISTTNSGPVCKAITEKLTKAFNPVHLEVRNESHMHNVPQNSETHFKVIVISDLFKNAKTPISRHRLINETLKDEVAGPVHALSIVAMTPDKWQAKLDNGESVGPSPNCRGGDGSLPKRH